MDQGCTVKMDRFFTRSASLPPAANPSELPLAGKSIVEKHRVSRHHPGTGGIGIRLRFPLRRLHPLCRADIADPRGWHPSTTDRHISYLVLRTVTHLVFSFLVGHGALGGITFLSGVKHHPHTPPGAPGGTKEGRVVPDFRWRYPKQAAGPGPPRVSSGTGVRTDGKIRNEIAFKCCPRSMRVYRFEDGCMGRDMW